MEELTEEPAELVERVAALDIGKASLVCCVRVPHESRLGARRQEVRTWHRHAGAAGTAGLAGLPGHHPGSDGGLWVPEIVSPAPDLGFLHPD